MRTQVCFGTYDLLLSPGIKGLKQAEFRDLLGVVKTVTASLKYLIEHCKDRLLNISVYY